MKKHILKISIIFVVALMLLGLPIVAGKIANEFPARSVDPSGAFWWISVHHIAQVLLFVPFIIVIKILNKKIDFGFKLGDTKKGFNYVLKFTLFFLVYTLISSGIVILTDSFQAYNFPLNARNIFGYLGFQLFLSGPSEEILFRAFGITIIALLYKKRIMKGKLSVANLIIAVIFGLAHVGIYFSPLHFDYNLVQLFYAFGLGLIYGDCYERTGSVIYPMMIHSISNVIAVSATMLLTIIL